MLKINKNIQYLAIAILIGGKSTRFGSDKGLFKFKGKPLISYQLETLGHLRYNIFLAAKSREQVANYIEKINYKKITGFTIDDHDIILNKTVYSPMLGLYTVFKDLNDLGYEKILVLPCDNPFIKIEVLEYMIKQSEQYDCCIPQWNNGFLEPLIAIYPVYKAFLRVKENLLNNKFKLINIIDKNWNINYISIENSIKNLDKNLISFMNINKPSDIENFL